MELFKSYGEKFFIFLYINIYLILLTRGDKEIN